jgi:polar amino acid transport system ATP-binding protein
MKAGLVVEDLCFGYNDSTVLKGFSLAVPAGGICGLIGPSGSGKTSLIKCLLFLEHASSGRVTYRDRVVDFGTDDLRGGRERIALRKRIGYLPQSSILLPHLNAEQNVMLPLTQVHRQSREVAERRARAALEAVGVGSLGHKPPWRMSGGQQQRVALARALAIEPALFLLDEPTAALDARSSHLVADVLRADVQARGASALIVTHNLGFARRVCDSIALLSEGRIAWHLKTAEVAIEQALEELG